MRASTTLSGISRTDGEGSRGRKGRGGGGGRNRSLALAMACLVARLRIKSAALDACPSWDYFGNINRDPAAVREQGIAG